MQKSVWNMELLGRFQHFFVSKGWFSMSKVERKELVTQMRIVNILFTGTNGAKFMTIWICQFLENCDTILGIKKVSISIFDILY